MESKKHDSNGNSYPSNFCSRYGRDLIDLVTRQKQSGRRMVSEKRGSGQDTRIDQTILLSM